MLLTRWTTSGKAGPLSGPRFLICQERAGRAEVEGSPHPSVVTAPLPPWRAVPGKSPLRAPLGPPLPASRPLASHPEPFLLVRLDLGVQLPQGIREAAEEQVLADQLVSALHRLRHRCASAVRVRGGQGTEGRGLARRGRGRARAYQPARTARRAPVAPPRPRPQPRPAVPSSSASPRSYWKTRCSPEFSGSAGGGFVIFELLKVAAAVQFKEGWTLENIPDSHEAGKGLSCPAQWPYIAEKSYGLFPCFTNRGNWSPKR